MKRYFFAGFALGVLLLFSGWWVFYETVLDFDLGGGGYSDYTTEQLYSSPDRKYTAYRFIESGGGAAGWCYRCVGLDGSDAEHEIFRIVPAQTELEIEWIDAKTLSITYEIGDYTSTWRNQPQQLSDVTVVFNPNQSTYRTFKSE